MGFTLDGGGASCPGAAVRCELSLWVAKLHSLLIHLLPSPHIERLLLPFEESTISNLIFTVDPTDPVLPTDSQGQTDQHPLQPERGLGGDAGLSALASW